MIKTGIKSLLIVLGVVILLSLIGYVVTRREGLVKGEVFVPTPEVTITPTVVLTVSPTGISTSSAVIK